MKLLKILKKNKRFEVLEGSFKGKYKNGMKFCDAVSNEIESIKFDTEVKNQFGNIFVHMKRYKNINL